MSDIDPVEQAVGAWLEYLEMGGRAPDFSGLDPEVRTRVDDVIGMLDLTEGIALRTAHPEEQEPAYTHHRTAKLLVDQAGSDLERQLLAKLDAALPPSAPVDPDLSHISFVLGDLTIRAGWSVGTLGGRIRVWLTDLASAGELEKNVGHLVGLDRVFRAFPETAAICLVGADLNSILLEPQDCAPVIEVPAGSMSQRRYRRPIQPVAEAVSSYIRELIPAWEALPRFDARTTATMDVAAMAKQAASESIQLQQDSGLRARYPKKEVLGSLGDAEIKVLTDLALRLYEGKQDPDAVEAELRKLAKPR